MDGNAQFNAKSSGSGDAGNILITASDDLMIYSSAITTEAASADGGNIKLNVRDIVYLDQSEITAAVGGGAGNGGNIDIDPQFVILNDSLISANAVAGNGGNIRIVSDYFLSTPNSSVTASSELGIDGEVEIDSPNTDISNSLVALPNTFLDTGNLLKERCTTTRFGSESSSLVVSNSEGTPASPDGYLPSFGLGGSVDSTNHIYLVPPNDTALARSFGTFQFYGTDCESIR